jgi:hypothetical protein
VQAYQAKEQSVEKTLHLTSGDCAGELLTKSGISGEVFVWHDILYDGPRIPGWPDTANLEARARFLEGETGGGLKREFILATLLEQYRKLADAAGCERVVLWFDACLFDQSMLVHVLNCLSLREIRQVELLCVAEFPGIVPYHGLGQLQPSQLDALYDQRRPVSQAQFDYSRIVDLAFANRDQTLLSELAGQVGAPLPWIPSAVTRWLQELPDPATGLGRLEDLILKAIRAGAHTPGEIFSRVAALDTPPQFWGDSTLWKKINGLADRRPPLLEIAGPQPRLPQWQSDVDLNLFRITKTVDAG